ncbi:MAG: hypothetical protein F6K40_12205 [Okeania sp. SIO3I5]|uniref:hypothetical protein n=1 Tax=Okeania sp. SIO3I5 TaxID=2607805 RepID=UPI0013BAD938|nr:hypothetical protein [Okeania sp. SIO3I5]NEQ36992.1 hypothetical protein [Okeania sp. SIO3I5]
MIEFLIGSLFAKSEDYNSDSFRSYRDLLGDSSLSEYDCELTTDINKSGFSSDYWVIEGSRAQSINKKLEYNAFVISSQYISKPGEYFKVEYSNTVFLALTRVVKDFWWNNNSIALWDNGEQKIAYRGKTPISEVNSSSREIKLQVLTNGNLGLLIDDSLVSSCDVDIVGLPYGFSATGIYWNTFPSIERVRVGLLDNMEIPITVGGGDARTDYLVGLE